MDLQINSGAVPYTVACTCERLDAPVAIGFKDRMREILSAAPREVLLDLSSVRFLDSSGLGALVAVLKLAQPDRRLMLSGMTPAVEKVFRLTRMDTVFEIVTPFPDAGRARDTARATDAA
ncbi:STAS domain-containing protein [Roseicyclus sp. F158]|uniref:STAS domain-containing protein n=1 Tax=Tropicimonas omnivorans TaxID=3075590 RepID=A0ABU3DCD8_9RHOB|nr:STAS domain-containing protein [Roseicyclus sp. F158]MDT0681363.1 STAS domain-containing protein [Roseicyclus sp. F158]